MIVYINNRDLLTWPRRMQKVLTKQGHRVIFVDNASTYEPLLEYYDQGMDSHEFEVELLPENQGHLAAFQFGQKLDEPYVVTDPDLDISKIPADWPEVLMAGTELQGTKCGFHLDDSWVPSTNPAWWLDDFKSFPQGEHPAYWSRIYSETEKCKYHEYPTDTTFALYPRGHGHYIGGLRTGKPYVARHLPWHIVLDLVDEDSIQIQLNEELFYYFTHANSSSTTKGRLADMLAAYAARKGK